MQHSFSRGTKFRGVPTLCQRTRRRIVILSTSARAAAPRGGVDGNRGEPSRVARRLAGWLLLLLVAATTAVQAQNESMPREFGTITGRVLDANGLSPLDAAGVLLEPLSASVGARNRATSTGATGSYLFAGLPPGRYRLTMRRVGYASQSVEVDLQPGSEAQVSLGLLVAPVTLRPLNIDAPVAQSYGSTRSAVAEQRGSRAVAARIRQQKYIAGDVRELTHGEVKEAVTLGETDLFRALQRIPGVTTRDDYTAVLWTRGAPWDQTRVFVDGLPLFNPTHAGWIFSAINPDGVGAVTFFPGYRSAQWGEGAAAVLDVETREGGSRGAFSGAAEVSLVTGRLAADGEMFDGRVAWMVAGRRTYVDWFTRAVQVFDSTGQSSIPYNFSDAIGRVDFRIAPEWGVAASGIVERDYLRGDLPGVLVGNRARWGNRAGRISVYAPLGPVKATVSGGETHFATAIEKQEQPRRPLGSLLQKRPATTLDTLNNVVDHRSVSVRFEPRDERDRAWAAGVQRIRQNITYSGPYSPIAELVPEVGGDSLGIPITYISELAYTAFWGERRWQPHPRWELQTGLRAEVGEPVVNGGRLRLAPRFSGRYWADSATALSASWSRTYQYTQDIGPAAGPLGPQLHLTHFWVSAQSVNRPAIRADVAQVGIEHRLTPQWWLNGNVYGRRSTGLRVANPAPGMVLQSRSPEAAADNTAYGAELSARKLAGRWTGAVSYAYGVSELDARSGDPERPGEWHFASPADVRHSLDLTSSVRVARNWQAGGAFTYASGVPYTQFIIGDAAELGEPNAQRTLPYASLDLQAEYTRNLGGWQLSGFVQLRNALNRENRITYVGSRERCPASLENFGQPPCAVRTVEDRFQAGVPRVPLFGVRVVF